MPGPWEKYQSNAEPGVGTPPWEKYKSASPAPATEEAPQPPAATPWAKYAPEVSPEYTRVRQIIERPVLDANVIGTEQTTDEEINAIAKHHGVNPEELRSIAPYFGAKTVREIEEAPKYLAGAAGRVLGELPQFAYKKMQEDTNYRKALDDLRDLTQKKRSWAEFAAESVVPVGRGAKLFEKGAETGAKALGKAAAEGAATGAAFGLGGSTEGHEAESALLGAGIGGVLGSAAHGLQAKGRAATEAEQEATKSAQADLTRGAEEVAAKRQHAREVEQQVILENKGKPDLDNEQAAKVLSSLDPEELDRLRTPKSVTGDVVQQAAAEEGESVNKHIAESIVEDRYKQFASKLAREIDEDVPSNLEGSQKTIDKFRKQYGDETLSRAYKLFDEEQNALEHIKRNSVEAAPDPYSGLNKLGDWLSDMKYVIRDADEKFGTKLEPIHNELNSRYNRYTFANELVKRELKKLEDVTSKSGIAPDQIYDIIDRGVDTTSLPQDKQSVINEWKKFGQQLLETAKRGDEQAGVAGLPIQERANYVPYRVKDLPEYIIAVEQKSKEMEQKLGKPLEQLTDSEFNKLKRDPEFQEFLQGIGYMDNREIGNVAQMQNQLRRATTPAVVRDAQNMRARATFQRDEENIPEWIREKDVRKLYDSWARNTLRYMYIKEPLEQLRSQSKILSKVGADRQAEYVNKAITDMLTMREGTIAKSVSNIANNIRVKAERGLSNTTNPLAKSFYEAVVAAPDLLSELGNNIYPNFLGLNARALIRNITQPVVMSIPELGYKYGTYVATRAYADTVANLPHLIGRLEKMGLMPSEFIGEAPGYLARGIRQSSLYKLPKALMDRINKATMFLYTMSDTVNRAVTLSMADKLTADLLHGSKYAQEALAKFPTSIRRMAIQLIEQGNSEQLNELIAKHLNSSTQFNYNRLSMSQFGRDLGPLFSVFSKWPTAIAGDILQNLRSKGIIRGGSRAAAKYMLPLTALGMMQRALVGQTDEMDDRSKKLIGSKGLTDWAPVTSLESMATGRIVQPPAVSAVTGVVFNALKKDKEPDEQAKEILGNLTQAFVPGMGLVRFLTDDLVTLISNQRPEGTFFERTEEGTQRLTHRGGQ